MKRRCAPSTLSWTLLILLLTLGVCQADDRLFKGELSVEKFHTEGLAPDGKGSWSLDGQSADIRGKVVTLELFTAQFLQPEGESVRVESARCRFIQALREVKSDSPVLVMATGIRASGIGYDIFFDRRIVKIRSAVSVVIQRENLETSLKKVTERLEQK